MSTSTEHVTRKQRSIEDLRTMITNDTILYLVRRRISRRGIETLAIVRATDRNTILPMTALVAGAVGIEYDDLQQGIIMRGWTVPRLIGNLSLAVFGEQNRITVEWL